MNSPLVRQVLRVILFGLPYAILMVFGTVWLYERRYFLYFALVTSAVSVAGWLVLRWLSARPTQHDAPPPPVATWPKAGENAWDDVQRIVERVERQPPAFGDSEAYLKLFREVLDTVAKQFYPKSNEPAWEITVSQALAITERVARDFRTVLDEQVPLSNQVTIRNIRSIQRLAEWTPIAEQIYSAAEVLYRMGRFVLNPFASVISEAQVAVAGTGSSNLLADLPRLAAGYCVRRVGYYAIQMYSGQSSLDQPEFANFAVDKPLRILLLGQTKAGKSSLVNALFGRTRAQTDVLPCTTSITEYVIEREGLPKAIVLDTEGFGGTADKTAREKLDQELGQTDLIIVVTSARTAAREPDRRLLDEARLRFAEQTKRSAPPEIVALTHVDTVRPQNEWNPPYDFLAGERPKEQSVRDAIEAVAHDLQVRGENVVPLCLREGAVYNLDEGLLVAVARVLPDSERAKLLRILMDSRSAADRERIKRQLLNAGVNILSIAAAVTSRYVTKQLAPSQKIGD